MTRALPKEAYGAFKAIQDRAVAIRGNNYRGDNLELRDALRRIHLNQPWSSVIERSIASMPGKVDPLSLDETWLEDLLSEDANALPNTSRL